MKHVLLIAASCIMLCACQSTVNTVENKDKNMQRNSVDTSKISTDSFLKRRLKIERIDKVEQPDGLLKIQVTAQNLRYGFWDQIGTWFMGDNPYQITYRFSWLDKNGMEVKTATNTWIPMSVMPGDTVRIMGISPNPRCKDFLLAIRENIKERQ
jgi:uncharacterized protein YcfL